jgi:CRP-like cAMP-binding protein
MDICQEERFTINMTSQTVLKVLRVLRAASLTRNLNSEVLHRLAAMSSELEFEENEIIYRAGDIGEAIFIVGSGQVIIERDVPDHAPVIIHTLGPGQSFGWSAIYPHERWSATARAAKPTRVVAIKADRMRKTLWS